MYSQKAAFSFGKLAEQLRPWLQKDLEERGDEELPREGIGCWHPVFPATATDIDLMVSMALKTIATDFEALGSGDLWVFEQIVKDKAVIGVRRVEK